MLRTTRGTGTTSRLGRRELNGTRHRGGWSVRHGSVRTTALRSLPAGRRRAVLQLAIAAAGGASANISSNSPVLAVGVVIMAILTAVIVLVPPWPPAFRRRKKGRKQR